MKRSVVQVLSSILIVALLLTAFGCYGSFQLTNKVYKFNGTLGNKWVNELGFIVMVVVPVYGVAAFVDAVVLNSLEFWTGKNPMTAANGIQTIQVPDGSVALNGQDQSYTFRQTIDGKEKMVRVTTSDGITTATDEQGNVLARSSRTADGGVTVYDALGNVVSTVSHAQVESMVASK
jgi:hypothetical protein